MPGQDDTREFDRIVKRLRADDPDFADRVGPEPAPRPRRRLRAVLLGIFALFSMVLGGWTGLIIAIVVTIWAVRLILADRDA